VYIYLKLGSQKKNVYIVIYMYHVSYDRTMMGIYTQADGHLWTTDTLRWYFMLMCYHRIKMFIMCDRIVIKFLIYLSNNENNQGILSNPFVKIIFFQLFIFIVID